MKRASIIYLAMMMVLLATVAFVSSCTKEGVTPNNPDNSNKTSGTCLQTYELLAGKTINAGQLLVDNDANNLYVTYVAKTGTTFNTLHLWVGKDMLLLPMAGNGNPIPGHFPYVWNLNGGTTYTFTIPLNTIAGFMACPATNDIYIVAHAEWVGSTTETAFGGDTPVNYNKQGRWYRYAKYTTCCPIYVPVCYGNETAWSFGPRYNLEHGNWATYTAYDGIAKTVNLYAGQNELAGTVTFEPSLELVNITISLNTGWSLQNVSEPIKIQGYQTAPSGNPAPGLFDTYKGSSLINSVSAFNFYGVHVDVREVVTCQ